MRENREIPLLARPADQRALLCPRSPVYAKDPTVSRMRSMGSGACRVVDAHVVGLGAFWRIGGPRRHDVSAELYAWLNREYARLGPIAGVGRGSVSSTR